MADEQQDVEAQTYISCVVDYHSLTLLRVVETVTCHEYFNLDLAVTLQTTASVSERG